MNLKTNNVMNLKTNNVMNLNACVMNLKPHEVRMSPQHFKTSM